MISRKDMLRVCLLGVGLPAVMQAQELRSAPITDIHYEVTFNSETARASQFHVVMSFNADGSEPVILSLPAWTPGSYEIANFARFVSDFSATTGGNAVRWDMIDFDTWRVSPEDPGMITVSFNILADTLDNGMAWAQDDFGFFNGTNAFLYPEGLSLDFPSTVTINTEDDWLVATGMRSGGAPRAYAEQNFHDLVDMPVFVGRFDYDSVEIEGLWYRFATYPEGTMVGTDRQVFWQQIEAMVPPQAAVFGEIPWQTYTTLIVFDPDYPGGSALEHQNSHLAIYTPGFIGNLVFPLITAHEMLHAWNVKRLRPHQMVPYDYSRPQATELLWVSEGITDYYADLALVRGGIVPPQVFYQLTSGKIGDVGSTPPVALEDASLSTWIGPTDGTEYIYYDKGSLAGFMLDIAIRNMTDNRKSLDDVMRDLYHATYKQGRGFTNEEWWRAVRNVTGGRRFDDFYHRFIDGREEYPWDEVLATIGLTLNSQSVQTPWLGISHSATDDGMRINAVSPGSSADQAGVQVGDILVRIGDIDVENQTFGAQFRHRYGNHEPGTAFDIIVRRGDETLTLEAHLRFADNVQVTLEEDPTASARAREIREGILTGTTSR
ncbi:MAG: PDZ domain-containing protein [Gemmatimonadales bacterium]